MNYKIIWAVINGGSGGISERVEMTFYNKYDAETYVTNLIEKDRSKQYTVVPLSLCEN